MKKCYIAGALNGMSVDYIKNLHAMGVWSECVRSLGFSVFVPGVDFLLGFLHGNWGYSDYFDNSQPWLKVADCLFVCPGYEESTGTKIEINTAERNRIPIFYDLPSLREFKNK